MHVLAVAAILSLAASVQPCCDEPCTTYLRETFDRIKEKLNDVIADPSECCVPPEPTPTDAPEDPIPTPPAETPDGMSPTRTGIDCPGNDLEVLDDADFDTCSSRCMEITSCSGFVYSEFEDAQAPCVLKQYKFCPNIVEQPDTWAYRKDSKRTRKDPGGTETWEEINQPPENYNLVASGMDCPENQIRANNFCFWCCSRTCSMVPECIGFVYTLEPDGVDYCMLKREGVCDDPQPVPRANTVVYMQDSTIEMEDIEEAPSNNYVLAVSETGINCPGNDLETKDSWFGGCSRSCTGREDCVGFVFSIHESFAHNCVLKHTAICDGETPHLEGTVAWKKVRGPQDPGPPDGESTFTELDNPYDDE